VPDLGRGLARFDGEAAPTLQPALGTTLLYTSGQTVESAR